MNAEFSRTLSLLRQEKGVSQRTAAGVLGISQALLSHYENGIREPGLTFVVKACDYYGVVGSIGQEEVNDRATLTSSNPKVAVIDEAGKLKAIGLGTTTITATVKDDPAKRKVTMSVKVIARQVGEIRITMKTTNPLVSSIEENGILKQLTLDARDVRNIKNGIELYIILLVCRNKTFTG